jgi:predicted GIY-YIG superfamily endonuclease
LGAQEPRNSGRVREQRQKRHESNEGTKKTAAYRSLALFRVKGYENERDAVHE